MSQDPKSPSYYWAAPLDRYPDPRPPEGPLEEPTYCVGCDQRDTYCYDHGEADSMGGPGYGEGYYCIECDMGPLAQPPHTRLNQDQSQALVDWLWIMAAARDTLYAPDLAPPPVETRRRTQWIESLIRAATVPEDASALTVCGKAVGETSCRCGWAVDNAQNCDPSL